MSSPTPVPPDRGTYGQGHEKVARAEVDGDLATIYNVRDTRYPAIDKMETHWADWTVDLRELTNLWVMVGYFSSVRAIAHVEVIFEFSDSRNLLASFEIRPLKGQRYSLWTGFTKTFELTLRWANERDNLLRRVMKSKPDTEMHLLEFDITHRQMIDLFHAAARRTNELADSPEWYNTATNACAGNMVNLAHEILPGKLKKTRRVVLPGLMPKFWADQGMLKLTGTFDETMDAARINQRCLDIGDVDDFSRRLHNRH